MQQLKTEADENCRREEEIEIDEDGSFIIINSIVYVWRPLIMKEKRKLELLYNSTQ